MDLSVIEISSGTGHAPEATVLSGYLKITIQAENPRVGSLILYLATIPPVSINVVPGSLQKKARQSVTIRLFASE